MINAKFTPINQEKEPEKWLELRQTGIGGSDAGAIMGMNEYSSPLTIFLQKKGQTQSIDSEVLRWGHILEDPIRKEVEKNFNVKVSVVEGMYTSNENSFMNANLDGLIEGTVTVGNKTVSGEGGLEIKTTNGNGFGDNEIPDSYYCQCQHYMAVTGLEWFLLAAFFKNSCTIVYYIINRDDEFIQSMIDKEKEFWEEFVQKDVYPAPTGASNENDIVKTLPISENIQLDDDLIDVVQTERDIDSQIKELKKQQDILKNQILLALHKASNGSDSKAIVTEIGDFRITYSSVIKKSVDSDKLKKEGIFDMYSKESESKTLRISRKK